MDISQIREELDAKVKTIAPLGKKLKFNLDGEILLIDGTGPENVLLSDDLEADCTISMSRDTYLKIQRREIKPMMATLTGKLKVKGDIGLAQKLKQLR